MTKYNRIDAGARIRKKRMLLGLTQDIVAEQIGLSAKYYADIERGTCGMSIETLISLSETLDMTMDYIIHGKTYRPGELQKHTEEVDAILSVLDNVPQNKRQYAMRILQLQLASWMEQPDQKE